jgi:hypothetical protein
MSRGIQALAMAALYYLFNANGAILISAWGNAPGSLVKKDSIALKAPFS